MGRKEATALPEAGSDAMLVFEERAWAEGAQAIAGVDEAGRGCLFGDVVAAAGILPRNGLHEDIRDAKQLSGKKREELYEWITAHAAAWSVATGSPAEIDRSNSTQAARPAMNTAVAATRVRPD